MTKARLLAFILAFVASGCRVDRAPMDAAHAERVDEIDREYERDVAENAYRWAKVEKKVLELRQFLIEIEPGTEATPKNPVAGRFLSSFEKCAGSPEAPTSDGTRAACEAAVRQSFWQAFEARYYRADLNWVQQQSEANPDLDVEWLATKSHNAAVQAMIDRSLAEIRQHKADFQRSLKDGRDDRVLRSARERDQEVESAEQERRAAWAGALRGFAQGMQSAAQSAGTSTPTYTTPATPGYSSASPGTRSTAPYSSAAPPDSSNGCTSD